MSEPQRDDGFFSSRLPVIGSCVLRLVAVIAAVALGWRVAFLLGTVFITNESLPQEGVVRPESIPVWIQTGMDSGRTTPSCGRDSLVMKTVPSKKATRHPRATAAITATSRSTQLPITGRREEKNPSSRCGSDIRLTSLCRYQNTRRSSWDYSPSIFLRASAASL